jgi:hypothetical protein
VKTKGEKHTLRHSKKIIVGTFRALHISEGCVRFRVQYSRGHYSSAWPNFSTEHIEDDDSSGSLTCEHEYTFQLQ